MDFGFNSSDISDVSTQPNNLFIESAAKDEKNP